MKKIFFLLILVGSLHKLYTQEESLDEITVLYKIINDNSQKIIQKVKPSGCCSDVSNSHLLECFFSLPIAQQREAFKQFSPTKRRECLRQFDPNTFEKFLKAYSEHEWKELYDSLTDYERTYWPKTVKEQLIELQNIKDFCNKMADALTLLTLAGGSCINPIFFIYEGYVIYDIARTGENPVKVLFIHKDVERYLEKTYEL